MSKVFTVHDTRSLGHPDARPSEILSSSRDAETCPLRIAAYATRPQIRICTESWRLATYGKHRAQSLYVESEAISGCYNNEFDELELGSEPRSFEEMTSLTE